MLGGPVGSREEKMMAFILTHHISTIRGGAMLRTIAAVMRPVTMRRTLTPQERANLRASRPLLALTTASLGGHPQP